MHTTKHDTTHTDSDLKKRTILCLPVKHLPLMPYAEFCASLTDNSTTFSILRSQLFAGTGKFLAGLFTFLSSRPNTNGSELVEETGWVLSSWLWKKNKSEFAASFALWCCATKYSQFHMQMNGGKLPLTGDVARNWYIGSELPLTFRITQPGLAAVKVDMFWQLTLHTPKCQTDWAREKLPETLNAFCHTNLKFIMCNKCVGFE